MSVSKSLKTNKEQVAEQKEKIPEISEKKKKKLANAKKRMAKKNKKKKKEGGASLDDKIVRKETARRLRFEKKLERAHATAVRGQAKIDKQIEKLKAKKEKAFDKRTTMAEKEFARRQKVEASNPAVKSQMKAIEGLEEFVSRNGRAKKVVAAK